MVTATATRQIAGLATSAILDDVEEFLAETGMVASAFGRQAMNDPSFVGRLRGGRDCLFATEEKARRQMANWRRLGRFDDPKTLRARRVLPPGVNAPIGRPG
jgi:hypothetical protein